MRLDLVLLRSQLSHDLNIAIHTYDYIADVARQKAEMFAHRKYAISNYPALKVPCPQAHLVAARAETERKGPGAHLVEITVSGKK